MLTEPQAKLAEATEEAAPDTGHETVATAETTNRRSDSRRVEVEQPIRVRTSSHARNRFDDVEKTSNASRKGVYFTTHRASYSLGMRVLVTVPYSPGTGSGIEYLAEVVRMQILDPETFGVAVRLLMPTGASQ